MSRYTPDKWVLLKITKEGREPAYKIFASWHGGYLYGDSWRMNTGVAKVSCGYSSYTIEGPSGSVYVCPKDMYGTTAYSTYVLGTIQEGNPNVTIEVMEEDEAKKYLVLHESSH